jgi:hypothetical protein
LILVVFFPIFIVSLLDVIFLPFVIDISLSLLYKSLVYFWHTTF